MANGKVPHIFNSPFPIPTAQGQIVDEKCRCGLLRSQHYDTAAYGHGSSPLNECHKFTWVSFVVEDE